MNGIEKAMKSVKGPVALVRVPMPGGFICSYPAWVVSGQSLGLHKKKLYRYINVK